MPELILRERALDAACFLAGRVGRVVNVRVKDPFFIIGTGRCGTTLLVKILGTHAGLSGFPGEANELWHPKLEPFESTPLDTPPIEVNPKQFSEVSIAQWPPKHGETLRDVFTGFHLITGPAKVVFTKSAMISFMIPKILEVFPAAKFIHIYRFGPSVVKSYVEKNFGKYSRHKFAQQDYRLHCARYWNDCILEIEKQKNDLALVEKGQFLEFSYENLCEKPREVLADLAKYLGVPFDGFRFDVSRIANQNYKVATAANNLEGAKLLEVMSPGMALKGYLNTSFQF
jgi:hypothetical protein